MTLKLRNALEEIIKEDYLEEWLNKPIPAFDNLTPNQVVENGEEYKIFEMISQIENGLF